MKNDVIRLDKTRGARLIEQNYILTCGLDKDKPALKKIYPHAMECLDAVMKKADIRAVVSEYSPECIRNGELVIEQEHFPCPALKGKISSGIISVICFAITSGDIYTDNIRVLDQAYFDIGGTAVTDAGRDLLRAKIAENFTESVFVSTSFGPGFYGMPASDVVKFFRLLDCGSIGITLLPSGFMLPAKSCVGFFIISKKQEALPVMDCKSCLGKGKMCYYCKAGRQAR